MIYSHTSMFPNQLQSQEPGFEANVGSCATEILQAAHTIISQERYELRFIVFPLFMAGFATNDPNEKDLALNMIKIIERHSFGGSTEGVRRLLETVYDKQHTAISRAGTASSVDLIEEMESSGQRLIVYGL